jgi:hypothetical protein
VTQDCVVCWSAIIGSIGSELADLIINLIKQWLQLRALARRKREVGTAVSNSDRI